MDEIREAFDDYTYKNFDGDEDYNFSQKVWENAWQASRQNIGIVPPNFKECPECRGFGDIETMSVHCYAGEHIEVKEQEYCETCEGEGKLPIFYTPEEYTAWMRNHVNKDWVMPETMPVICKPKSSNNWISCEYQESLKRFNHFTGLTFPNIYLEEFHIIVATEAGKPSSDWRPIK